MTMPGGELPRCSKPRTASGPACTAPAVFRLRLDRTELLAYACAGHLATVDTLCQQTALYTGDDVTIDRLTWAPVRAGGRTVMTPRPTDYVRPARAG